MNDFFISYTKADQSWAEWIAWQLEQEGYTTIIQAWDFRPGGNFIIEMQKATENAKRTVMVLSPSYLSALYTQPEWAAASAKDPTGEKRKLLPVRISECEPKGMLAQVIYIDLIGLDNNAAKRALLKGIYPERVIPLSEPTFPGTEKQPEDAGPRFPGKLPPIWNIPFLRNPNFTGRDEYLSRLESELKSGSNAALTQAIRGMGGIGKTQIVLEYAYRYSTNYQAIWWIKAEDNRTLAADYAAFAIKAELPEKDASEEQVVINAVRSWIEHNQNWLFIFDNAVKPEDIHDYLPRGKSGHVLITSRYQEWKEICPSLRIGIWPREESVDFLNRRTKDKDKSSAEILAEKLGDLPLALEQAAAFINESAISFDDYLKLYQTRRKKLWDAQNPPINYPDTVVTTWSLAIEKVREEAPAGASALNFFSYFAPDEIPRALIDSASSFLPEELSTLFNDTIAVTLGIKILNQYSLVNAQPDSLSVHRLVQLVVRDRLKKEEQKIWAKAAVQSVNAIFPSDGYQKPRLWQKCAILLPHGKVVVEHADENKVALETSADLLIKISSYFYGRASYKEAENLSRRSLIIMEALLEEDHIDVGRGNNWVGFTLVAQGRYNEAEPLYRRGLKICEKQLGSDHPEVAVAINNLALLLHKQERYTESESLHRRALEIREKHFSADPISVANSLNNLAGLLKYHNKYTEADPLFRRALQICEKKLGVNHSYVATIIDNLGGSLCDQSKDADAEPLYRRALKIRETQFGEDHPKVAISLNNLASLLENQGKYTDAEPLYRRALEIYETKLGTNHPNTNTVRNSLETLINAIASKNGDNL